ncbi:hypothetical protein CLOM_g13245 [Closterium sp. NIES-68]|nr:hypothetical protein CLOM_g13245 [Closterium sp. NIES-68]GJP83925.1 hypothetical protein CLOP_g14026 [Closterium sp. NIES-67]
MRGQHSAAGETAYARNLNEYNAVALELSRCRKPFLMRGLYSDMLMDGVAPNFFTFHAAITACMRAGRLHDVIFFFNQMKARGITPDRYMFNCVMSACSRSGHTDRAFRVAEEMQAAGFAGNIRTFQALLSACSASGRHIEAQQVMERMAAEGVALNKFCYSALITLHQNRRPFSPHTVEKIFSLLEESQAVPTFSLDTELAGTTDLSAALPVGLSPLSALHVDMEEELALVPQEGALSDVGAYGGQGAGRGRGGGMTGAGRGGGGEAVYASAEVVVHRAALRAFLDAQHLQGAVRLVRMIEESGIVPDAAMQTLLLRVQLLANNEAEALKLADKYYGAQARPYIDQFVQAISFSLRDQRPIGMTLALRLLALFFAHGFYFTRKKGSQLLQEAIATDQVRGMAAADLLFEHLVEKHQALEFDAVLDYMRALRRRHTPKTDHRWLLIQEFIKRRQSIRGLWMKGLQMGGHEGESSMPHETDGVEKDDREDDAHNHPAL